MCDFSGPLEKRTYSRFSPYQLIRIKHGTGIVLLAGNEHGRRCMAHKNAAHNGCPRPRPTTDVKKPEPHMILETPSSPE